jgi:signal transduction histidine kinase
MTQDKSKSLFRTVQDVRREQLPLALVMLCYFFLVISTFWTLRPIERFGCIPRISCHPSQLNQVFLNLLINASQAIAEPRQLVVCTSLENGNVHVAIQDNGVGISAKI